MELVEGKIIRLTNPNENNISYIQVIQNPTKLQLDKLLTADKYNVVRGFVTETDLYCWRGFCLTHNEAIQELKIQEGLEIEPLCKIVINNDTISVANTENVGDITKEDKLRILSNPRLEFLFGENLNILGL